MISFHSRDKTGNLEAAKTAAINVRSAGALTVSVDLKPETLNLKSQGEFESAIIEVSQGASASDIVLGSVRVSAVDGKAISPPVFLDPKGPTNVGDFDGDGLSELKVKFPREALNAVLPADKEVRVTVAGSFTNGAGFSADGTIRTIGKGLEVAVAGSADPAFRPVAAYAFPNPARGTNPTFRVQVGVADSVELKVYNVAGEVVYSATLGAARVFDDGNGKGPPWTYEYTWNVGRVASGVYLYQIVARKAGQGVIRQVKRLAVIR